MRPRGENVEYDKLRDRYESLERQLKLKQDDWLAECKRVGELEAALRGVLDVAEGRSNTSEAIMVIDRVRQALAQSETQDE